MPLLKLTGQGPELTLHLEHPIILDPRFEYRLALTGFYVDNNIPNLREKDSINFWDATQPNRTDSRSHIVFNPQYYTVRDIQNHCRSQLKNLSKKVDVESLTITRNGMYINITSPLQFYMGPYMCSLLGFNHPVEEITIDDAIQKHSYKANTKHVGTKPPNLRAFDVIEVHCNIVNNSLTPHDEHSHKHMETSMLYHFCPESPSGYKISEVPMHRHYVPLREGMRWISAIKVTVQDQNNRLLQNENTNYVIYLDLTETYKQ